MGGIFSNQSEYLDEWEADDIYSTLIVEKNKSKTEFLPVEADTSGLFSDLNPSGKNNIQRCINYVFLYNLKQIESLPYDYEEHFNFDTFVEHQSKSSIGNLLNILKEHYAENIPFVKTTLTPVNTCEIKDNIRNSKPLLVSFPVDDYTYTATESKPLSYSYEICESDTNLVGIVVGFNKNVYKLMLGDGTFIYVERDYIEKYATELWALSVSVHKKIELPYTEEDLLEAKEHLKTKQKVPVQEPEPTKSKRKRTKKKNKRKKHKSLEFLESDNESV